MRPSQTHPQQSLRALSTCPSPLRQCSQVSLATPTLAFATQHKCCSSLASVSSQAGTSTTALEPDTKRFEMCRCGGCAAHSAAGAEPDRGGHQGGEGRHAATPAGHAAGSGVQAAQESALHHLGRPGAPQGASLLTFCLAPAHTAVTAAEWISCNTVLRIAPALSTFHNVQLVSQQPHPSTCHH